MVPFFSFRRIHPPFSWQRFFNISNDASGGGPGFGVGYFLRHSPDPASPLVGDKQTWRR